MAYGVQDKAFRDVWEGGKPECRMNESIVSCRRRAIHAPNQGAGVFAFAALFPSIFILMSIGIL